MPYELIAMEQFLEDFAHWARCHPPYARKINELLESIKNNPRFGIGKPERLKYFKGEEIWSRRISLEDRLVYKIKGNTVNLIKARYHYR